MKHVVTLVPRARAVWRGVDVGAAIPLRREERDQYGAINAKSVKQHSPVVSGVSLPRCSPLCTHRAAVTGELSVILCPHALR